MERCSTAPPVSQYYYDWLELTPSASPYNLTTGAGSAAIDADWVIWMVCYSGSGNTNGQQQLFMRGIRNNGPCHAFDAFGTYARTTITGTNWASGNQLISHSVTLQDSLKFAAVKSYDDGGTRKYAMCEDGVNWGTGTAITATAGSPGATYNKWQLGFRSQGSDRLAAIGDAGFIAGTLSAADLLSLHTYLDDKYGGLDA